MRKIFFALKLSCALLPICTAGGMDNPTKKRKVNDMTQQALKDRSDVTWHQVYRGSDATAEEAKGRIKGGGQQKDPCSPLNLSNFHRYFYSGDPREPLNKDGLRKLADLVSEHAPSNYESTNVLLVSWGAQSSAITLSNPVFLGSPVISRKDFSGMRDILGKENYSIFIDASFVTLESEEIDPLAGFFFINQDGELDFENLNPHNRVYFVSKEDLYEGREEEGDLVLTSEKKDGNIFKKCPPNKGVLDSQAYYIVTDEQKKRIEEMIGKGMLTKTTKKSIRAMLGNNTTVRYRDAQSSDNASGGRAVEKKYFSESPWSMGTLISSQEDILDSKELSNQNDCLQLLGSFCCEAPSFGELQNFLARMIKISPYWLNFLKKGVGETNNLSSDILESFKWNLSEEREKKYVEHWLENVFYKAFEPENLTPLLEKNLEAEFAKIEIPADLQSSKMNNKNHSAPKNENPENKNSKNSLQTPEGGFIKLLTIEGIKNDIDALREALEADRLASALSSLEKDFFRTYWRDLGISNIDREIERLRDLLNAFPEIIIKIDEMRLRKKNTIGKKNYIIENSEELDIPKQLPRTTASSAIISQSQEFPRKSNDGIRPNSSNEEEFMSFSDSACNEVKLLSIGTATLSPNNTQEEKDSSLHQKLLESFISDLCANPNEILPPLTQKEAESFLKEISYIFTEELVSFLEIDASSNQKVRRLPTKEELIAEWNHKWGGQIGLKEATQDLNTFLKADISGVIGNFRKLEENFWAHFAKAWQAQDSDSFPSIINDLKDALLMLIDQADIVLATLNRKKKEEDKIIDKVSASPLPPPTKDLNAEINNLKKKAPFFKDLINSFDQKGNESLDKQIDAMQKVIDTEIQEDLTPFAELSKIIKASPKGNKDLVLGFQNPDGTGFDIILPPGKVVLVSSPYSYWAAAGEYNKSFPSTHINSNIEGLQGAFFSSIDQNGDSVVRFIPFDSSGWKFLHLDIPEENGNVLKPGDYEVSPLALEGYSKKALPQLKVKVSIEIKENKKQEEESKEEKEKREEEKRENARKFFVWKIDEEKQPKDSEENKKEEAKNLFCSEIGEKKKPVEEQNMPLKERTAKFSGTEYQENVLQKIKKELNYSTQKVELAEEVKKVKTFWENSQSFADENFLSKEFRKLLKKYTNTEPQNSPPETPNTPQTSGTEENIRVLEEADIVEEFSKILFELSLDPKIKDFNEQLSSLPPFIIKGVFNKFKGEIIELDGEILKTKVALEANLNNLNFKTISLDHIFNQIENLKTLLEKIRSFSDEKPIHLIILKDEDYSKILEIQEKFLNNLATLKSEFGSLLLKKEMLSLNKKFAKDFSPPHGPILREFEILENQFCKFFTLENSQAKNANQFFREIKDVLIIRDALSENFQYLENFIKEQLQTTLPLQIIEAEFNEITLAIIQYLFGDWDGVRGILEIFFSPKEEVQSDMDDSNKEKIRMRTPVKYFDKKDHNILQKEEDLSQYLQKILSIAHNKLLEYIFDKKSSLLKLIEKETPNIKNKEEKIKNFTDFENDVKKTASVQELIGTTYKNFQDIVTNQEIKSTILSGMQDCSGQLYKTKFLNFKLGINLAFDSNYTLTVSKQGNYITSFQGETPEKTPNPDQSSRTSLRSQFMGSLKNLSKDPGILNALIKIIQDLHDTPKEENLSPIKEENLSPIKEEFKKTRKEFNTEIQTLGVIERIKPHNIQKMKEYTRKNCPSKLANLKIEFKDATDLNCLVAPDHRSELEKKIESSSPFMFYIENPQDKDLENCGFLVSKTKDKLRNVHIFPLSRYTCKVNDKRDFVQFKPSLNQEFYPTLQELIAEFSKKNELKEFFKRFRGKMKESFKNFIETLDIPPFDRTIIEKEIQDCLTRIKEKNDTNPLNTEIRETFFRDLRKSRVEKGELRKSFYAPFKEEKDKFSKDTQNLVAEFLNKISPEDQGSTKKLFDEFLKKNQEKTEDFISSLALKLKEKIQKDYWKDQPGLINIKDSLESFLKNCKRKVKELMEEFIKDPQNKAKNRRICEENQETLEEFFTGKFVRESSSKLGEENQIFLPPYRIQVEPGSVQYSQGLSINFFKILKMENAYSDLSTLRELNLVENIGQQVFFTFDINRLTKGEYPNIGNLNSYGSSPDERKENLENFFKKIDNNDAKESKLEFSGKGVYGKIWIQKGLFGPYGFFIPEGEQESTDFNLNDLNDDEE